jgi:hypothetical protein
MRDQKRAKRGNVIKVLFGKAMWGVDSQEEALSKEVYPNDSGLCRDEVIFRNEQRALKTPLYMGLQPLLFKYEGYQKGKGRT